MTRTSPARPVDLGTAARCMTRWQWFGRLCLGMACAAALAPMPALAQHEHHGHASPAVVEQPDPHAHHHPAADAGGRASADVKPQSIRLQLADTPLVDQQGKRLRLRSDALGDRIMVVDFVYTTCTTVCPVLSAVMLQVQQQLAARSMAEVGLLTLTVDPVRDTPPRLKAFADKLGAAPGWAWLTGAKPQVDAALQAFGAYSSNFADHPPLVLVGDARAGRWLRFYGFPTPDQLLAAVSDLSAARARAGAGG